MRAPGFLFQQAVTIRPYLGSSAYGDVFGDEYTVRGRLEFGNQLVRDRDGNETVASGRLFLPSTDVSVLSIVVWQGVEYDIVDVQPQSGPNGRIHHVEVLLR